MRKVALLLVACGLASAQQAPMFQANDVVCFVGDSITHGGTYHSIVTLFYVTRFPDRPIRFYNEGIGGDRASMIMSDERYRLTTDILAKKCTAASIMLGMNDIGRNDYAEGKSGPEIEAKRAASLATYHENMQKLIEALQKSGAKLTLITPSIYEEAPKFADPAKPAELTAGCNAALGKCADEVREFAKECHAGVADFYGTMNKVNEEHAKPIRCSPWSGPTACIPVRSDISSWPTHS